MTSLPSTVTMLPDVRVVLVNVVARIAAVPPLSVEALFQLP